MSVFIVDSIIKNATIYPFRENGIRKFNNQLFITTALLEELMQNSEKKIPTDQASLRKGTSRIAGIIAHEFGHLTDMADLDGFEGQKGSAAYSQAKEVRADAEALLILRKAGFSDDSLLSALVHHFSKVPNHHTSLQAAQGSHPSPVRPRGSDSL